MKGSGHGAGRRYADVVQEFVAAKVAIAFVVSEEYPHLIGWDVVLSLDYGCMQGRGKFPDPDCGETFVERSLVARGIAFLDVWVMRARVRVGILEDFAQLAQVHLISLRWLFDVVGVRNASDMTMLRRCATLSEACISHVAALGSSQSEGTR